MTKEKFFLGHAVNFKDKFFVYPPTLNDIIDNQDSFTYLKLLTISQEDLEDIFIKNNKDKGFKGDEGLTLPTPFEYLLLLSYNDNKYEIDLKKAFKFFIRENVTFLYETKSVLIGDLDENVSTLDDLVLLKEEDFFDFQNLIRLSMGQKEVQPIEKNLHPKIRRMRALARYRDKVKAKQGDGTSLFTILSSICCMGIDITPLNIGELSYASVLELLNRYQEKEKYTLDIRSLLAGADSKKVKPKYWIRELKE